MKLLLVALAIIAAVAADVNELPTGQYLPPVEQVAPVTQEYLPPVAFAAVEAEPATVVADDGYRYKTVRRLKYRQRRDVNELPTGEYLPPVEQAAPVTQEYLPPVVVAAVEAEPATVVAEDGYRYKTVRRLKYRHRRDVNEIPTGEYLPPVEQVAPVTQEYLPPVVVAAVEAEPATVVADDGYRYKTVRRLKYRHRRDVNEIPTGEYLPPVEQVAPVTQEYLPPVVVAAVEAEPATVVAEDGYRYKTVRRLKYRHRRDVNEIPTGEYLPPVEQVAPVSQEYLPPVVVAAVEAEPATVVAEDGYRYKTVRRLKYRHRRDVNEIPTGEYLPPVEQVTPVTQEYLPPVVVAAVEAEPATVVAEDGYRYKTVRRLKYRHRRDVNEIPTGEYLPPVEQVAPVTQEYLPPVVVAAVEAEPATVVAEDGYRYKTVRRLKYRHRRDVNEIPTGEYLPPVEQVAPVTQEYLPPVVVAAVEAEPATVVAEDGYRYKTVRRLKYRHRRDVNEIPTGEYLPPVEQVAPVTQEYLPPVAVAAVVAEPATVVADDGYRYKTVRRLKYRHRRDVNEIPTGEYLPPVEQVAPVTQEYLPPVAVAAVVAEPATVVADDGYRYKTVRRLKYRHRRDVNEIPTGEYLPPVEQVAPVTQEYLPPVAVAAVVAEPATVVADDGYRYKTVRRLKYRNRY